MTPIWVAERYLLVIVSLDREAADWRALRQLEEACEGGNVRELVVACRIESLLVLLFPQIWDRIRSARGLLVEDRGASQ